MKGISKSRIIAILFLIPFVLFSQKNKKGKTSDQNVMNYEYYIDRDRIFEVEKDGRKIPTDLYGDSIIFLIENQLTVKNSDILLSTRQRKLEWLKQNHPELLL